MASSASPLPIAVIGAGFSGTMAALHLLPRLGGRPILLCERGESFARGVAYATHDPGHLLNVRAGNMSAFPDRPAHFLDWLAATDTKRDEEVHVTPAGTFVSRHLYGTYLAELLSAAVAEPSGASRLILVADEVVDLVTEEGGTRLVLAGGNSHRVVGAVLAAGNLLPEQRQVGPVVENPWTTPFTTGLQGGDPVVVIGSGLTMVDVALRLSHAGFPGPVVAVSRHGLRPRTHVPVEPWRLPDFTESEQRSPARMLRRIRREVEAAARAGVGWESVLDALRPVTSDLWRGFSEARQDGFLRHARAWWDVHRHRTAPPVGAAIESMIGSNFLRIRAAHVVSVTAREDGAAVTIRPRGSADEETIEAQRVIHASGSLAPDRCDVPLIRRMIERGVVRPDRHHLGLDQTENLRLVGRAGEPMPRLWGLGPLGTGAFWECVAVPDIRAQAARLAGEVAAELDGQP